MKRQRASKRRYRGIPFAIIRKRYFAPRLAWFRRETSYRSEIDLQYAIDDILDPPHSGFNAGDQVTIAVARWGLSTQDPSRYQGRQGTIAGRREVWDRKYNAFSPAEFFAVSVEGFPDGLFRQSALRLLPRETAWPGDLWSHDFPHWVRLGTRYYRCDGAVVDVLDSPETNSLRAASRRFVAYLPGFEFPVLYLRGNSRLYSCRRWKTASSAMRAVDHECQIACRCDVYRSESVTAQHLALLISPPTVT